jgi:hypothetical protein
MTATATKLVLQLYFGSNLNITFTAFRSLKKRSIFTDFTGTNTYYPQPQNPPTNPKPHHYNPKPSPNPT